MSVLASLDRRRVLSALLVLTIALGCGFVMQSVLVDETPVVVRDGRPKADPAVSSGAVPHPLPEPPAAALGPMLKPPPIMPDRVHPERNRKASLIPPASSAPCAAALALDPLPAALVRVSAHYPCAPNSAARVVHDRLDITVVTDAEGTLRVDLPAMSREATVTVIVADHAVSGVVQVPDADAFERVAVQWSGEKMLSMHAFEFGADRSQFGHVWAGSPKTPDRAMRGSGGFLMSLGSGDGGSAEVYSFPVGLSHLRGVVRLVVEAEVTDRSCGEIVRAQTLQTGILGLAETDVELKMPGCSAKGEIVRLQNLLQDMRLAGR